MEDVEREEREEAERQKGAGGAAPKPPILTQEELELEAVVAFKRAMGLSEFH